MSFSGAIAGQRRIVPVTAIPDFGEDGFFIKDDFTSSSGDVGELNWGFGGGSATLGVSAAGHPGIVRRDTGAVSGTTAYTRLAGTGTGNILPAEMFDMLWVFRLNQADVDTASRIGWGNDSSANPPNDGIYLEKLLADASWFAVTRAASAQTRSAAIAAVVAGAWNRLRVRRLDAATIGFTLNSAAEVTLAATIPAAALNPFTHIINGAAASKTLDLDFFSVRITGLSR